VLFSRRRFKQRGAHYFGEPGCVRADAAKDACLAPVQEPAAPERSDGRA
jgi:hypothetical protein